MFSGIYQLAACKTYAPIFPSSAKRTYESFKSVSEYPLSSFPTAQMIQIVFIACRLKESVASTLPAIQYAAILNVFRGTCYAHET